MKITNDILDDLGRIADKADNYAAAVKCMKSLPQEMHIEALTTGMEAISENIKSIYVKISGENPWEN